MREGRHQGLLPTLPTRKYQRFAPTRETSRNPCDATQLLPGRSDTERSQNAAI